MRRAGERGGCCCCSKAEGVCAAPSSPFGSHPTIAIMCVQYAASHSSGTRSDNHGYQPEVPTRGADQRCRPVVPTSGAIQGWPPGVQVCQPGVPTRDVNQGCQPGMSTRGAKQGGCGTPPEPPVRVDTGESQPDTPTWVRHRHPRHLRRTPDTRQTRP